MARGVSGAVSLLLLGVACSATKPKTEPPTAPVVASTGKGSLTQAQLDELIENTWREAKVTPAAVADDGEFLRRATLDLVGRVPTLEEAHAFLGAASTPDKRVQLVDRLLASPEFAEHWADVYGELLWGQEDTEIEKRAGDPRGWLLQVWNENRRWDRVAWDLITATGDLRENGAVAFIASRARGMGGIEAVAGATSRVFLGLQIQCAQCHDHPYDPRWKQEDFYGLVAYFARTRAKQEKLDPASMTMAGEGEAQMMAGMPPGKRPKTIRSVALFEQKRGQAKMRKPRTETDVIVQPKFLGRAVPERGDESRRETLARAIIASDLFPKTMVARTWAQLFGRSPLEPWDDLGGENDPKHPALLNALAQDFKASNFDVKHLVRRIMLSTAYARSSAAPAGMPDDGGAAVRAFARAAVRPLRPEQLFRALVTVTGVEAVTRRRANDQRVERLMAQALREYKFAFDDDEMAAADSFDGSVPQALLLLNGDLTNNGVRAAPGGVLGRILQASADPAARLEAMFLAAYARRPSDEEKAALLGHLRAGDARAAYEDVFFALLTSTEAVTNH